MYGTRDAGSIWEHVYGEALVSMDFTQGRASPCCFFFYHDKHQLSCVVHGDDFTCLGADASLDIVEKQIQEHFEVKLKGRLGLGEHDQRQMRVLNRIVHVSEEGLSYEPDPRHVELLCRDLGLQVGSVSCGTPGNKPVFDEEKHVPTDSLDDIITSIRALKKTSSRVTFNETVE